MRAKIYRYLSVSNILPADYYFFVVVVVEYVSFCYILLSLTDFHFSVIFFVFCLFKSTLSLLLDIAIPFCFLLPTEIFLGTPYFCRLCEAQSYFIVYIRKMFVAHRDSRGFFSSSSHWIFFHCCCCCCCCCCSSAALFCSIHSLEFISFGMSFSTVLHFLFFVFLRALFFWIICTECLVLDGLQKRYRVKEKERIKCISI